MTSGGSEAYADPAAGSSKPVEPEPFSYIPADVKAKMIAQQPYSAVAKEIQLSILSSAEGAGYAGIAVRERGVELWWKGRIPADVQQTVDAARRIVPVEVRSASHSRVELKTEAARLGAAMRADPASTLHMLQIPVDGSRVIAVFDKGKAAITGSTLRTSTSATGQSVTVGKGIPIEVVEHERLVVAGRYNDGATSGVFSGGAAIINNDNGARCTSGFGVKNGSGQGFLLTAGHCGRVGGGWSNGNGSRQIGMASAEEVAHDLLLIPTNADHFIWDGGATTNMFVKTAIGWDWARPGEYMCQSGSTSGAVCPIVNSDYFTYQLCDYDAYGNYECYNDLVYAATDGSFTACRGGDSGGPVFGLAAGYNQVIAKGTVTGCGGSVMVYQDFGTAWRDFGVVPIG